MHTGRVQNLFRGVFCVCTIVLLVPLMAQAEQIDSFVSDIKVQKDTTLEITETIEYKFDDQRHGIFRCIPTTHQDKASSLLKNRYIDIDITNVRMDAQSVPFEVTKERDQVCIQIGDPDSTVTGVHIYELSYTVGGAISYETYGGADLYWNVTGNDWKVPIFSVDARVYSPDKIFLTDRSCYRGVIGEADSCKMSVDENGIIHFGGTTFGPGEGVTIAQALDRSKIPTDIRERYKPLLIGIIALIFSLVFLGYLLYRYKTRFRSDNAIIPQYEPYPGVKPMYTGALFDGALDPRDITAGIVYLAEQGVLKIKKIEKKVLFFFEVDDYEITLVKSSGEKLDTFEEGVITLLFGKNVTSGQITLSGLQENFKEKQQRYNQYLHLRNSIEKDLITNGFFEEQNIVKKFTSPSGILFFGGVVLLGNPFGATQIYGVICILFAIAFGFSFRRRTVKGYEALDHLKGFKEFLHVTEKQRYIFHNAPEKSPEQFMQYLPYAIAFGVEKEWAKTFEGITIPNPNWYDGGSDAHAFSSIALTNSLGGFSSFITDSVSSPGGSGGSASGGGGFSGGGGGGGGGGSW